jgi:Rrf2 family protein
MAANTKIASAVQILCVIAYKGSGGTTAEAIARSLDTNPVVVRRMMKDLQRASLVEIRPGKDGGVQLRREPDAITLEDIHEAVEGHASVFALRPGGNPKCPVNGHMKSALPSIFHAVDEAVAMRLRQTTLASLSRPIA